MDIVLNDLPFKYLMENEYAVKNALNIFTENLIELKKSRVDVQLIYDKDINGIELAPGYLMAKLYNDKSIRVDQRRMILKTLTHVKMLYLCDENAFIWEGERSELCHYAFDENLLVISFLTIPQFDVPSLQGICEKKGKVLNISNIGSSVHIYMHGSQLGIRIYELNPKHKLGSNWGSPMDLDDSTAQEVLDSAIIYGEDDKCLVNYYNGKFYVFRRHINNYYHGYIDTGVPENIRRKFCEK